VALYLKDSEVDELARDLARLEHKSLTEAVRVALQERRDKVLQDREKRRREIEEILKEIWALPVLDDRDPDDMLYDEYGLPK